MGGDIDLSGVNDYGMRIICRIHSYQEQASPFEINIPHTFYFSGNGISGIEKDKVRRGFKSAVNS
jgi:hypothetical protein